MLAADQTLKKKSADLPFCTTSVSEASNDVEILTPSRLPSPEFKSNKKFLVMNS